MLQSIRDRAQGWIAWIIIGFIILTFALWGVQEYLGINEAPAIAVVDGQKIDQRQFQLALQKQRQNFQSMLGASYDQSLFDSPAIRKNVLEELVDDAVLVNAIHDNGMRVSQRQVAETITTFQRFQQDGKFSEALFQAYLRGEGTNQDTFFARLSGDIMKEQLYRGVSASSMRTAVEEADEARLLGQKREVAYMVVEAVKYLDKAKVADEEVNAYYQANAQQYMTDESVAIEYIELSMQGLADQLKVTDSELKSFYEQNKAQYTVAEQRRASHILVEVPANADEAADAAARTKAEGLLKQLKSGADFASLAKANSQDISSAKQGGDLGYFVSGVMAAPFDHAVFSMKAGQVSDLVRTEFGYHIIKLTGIRRDEKGFTQLRPQLENDYKRRQAEQQYYDMAEQLSNLTYEQADSLVPAAEALHLKVQSTDAYTRRTAQGMLADPKVIKAAFDPELIKSGYNSEAIELAKDHMMVLRVRDHKPASVKPLEQVRNLIVNQLRQQQARDLARKAAEEALAKMNAGEKPEAVAKAYAVKWLDKGSVGRNDSAKVDPSVLHQAFVVPKSNKTVYTMTAMRSGDTAVLAVGKVVEGSAPTMANIEQRARALQQRGNADFTQYINYHKSQADIERHLELLN